MDSAVTGSEVPLVEPAFHRILCPVDFSSASVAAIGFAFAIARRHTASVTVLHVLEGFPYETVYSGGRAGRLIGELEARIQETNTRLRTLVPAVHDLPPHDVRTVSGRARDAILAATADLGADLIVLGSSSRGRLERAVAGSIVTGVVANARCAVLVVPDNAT